MLFCQDAGYSLEKCVTFGQPKITNRDGAKKAAHLPLLRVINQQDVVPLVPPNTLLNLPRGGYVHFAPEVQLEPGSYVFRDESDERPLSHSFWWRLVRDEVKGLLKDVKDHYMQNYLHNLTSNIESGATQHHLTSHPTQTAVSDLQLSS